MYLTSHLQKELHCMHIKSEKISPKSDDSLKLLALGKAISFPRNQIVHNINVKVVVVQYVSSLDRGRYSSRSVQLCLTCTCTSCNYVLHASALYATMSARLSIHMRVDSIFYFHSNPAAIML